MADHEPYIPATHFPAELTPRALILGVLLGLIFSASSVYLALKIGLTVSSSIPIAVLSITIFRALGRTSILENNIVQTTGSASDSVAAGVVFTIPGVLLMGSDLDISRVAVLATVGGLMGVLMMIPLRRVLIVKEHDTLIYPEGTACAEVLIAGEERGLQAKRVFQAFGLGFVYKFLMGGLKLWPDVPGKEFRFYHGAAISSEISPELMGVGYIIGPRIAGYLFAGGGFPYPRPPPPPQLVGSRPSEPFRDLPGAGGGGLHHRPQDRGLPVRGRVLRLPRPRPRHQAGGLRAERAVRIPGGEADPRHEPGRDSRRLHLLHRRGRGRVGGDHRACPLAPDDRELLSLRPQGPARPAPPPSRHPAPQRRRTSHLPHRGWIG